MLALSLRAMIAGIGTDLVEIARIAEKITRNEAFKLHVFTQDEIAYCDSMKKPAMHYAARWAVKEAFLKAYGVKFIGNQKLPEIETVKDEHGNPDIKLSGETLEEFKLRGFSFAHVSISHTDSHAMAYVIIEK